MKLPFLLGMILIPLSLIGATENHISNCKEDISAVQVFGIIDFTLIDADNNVDLFTLNDGSQILMSEVNGRELNIRLNVTEDTASIIGRVEFSLTGALNREHTEFGAPYALYADPGGGEYFGQVFPAGDYELTATVYEETTGGSPFDSLNLSFSVVDDALGVQSFTLIDADNNIELLDLENGQEIANTLVADKNITIRANTMGNVGRVEFELTGPLTRIHTEFGAPYALYADAGTDNYFGTNFPPGNYTLRATAFTTEQGNETLGNSITIEFSITEVPIIEELIMIDESTGEELFVIEEGQEIFIDEIFGKRINIRPRIKGTISSVSYDGLYLSPRFRVNQSPFDAFDFGETLNEGAYQISATLCYSGRDCNQIGPDLVRTFFVKRLPNSSPTLPMNFEGAISTTGVLSVLNKSGFSYVSEGIRPNPNVSGINLSSNVYLFEADGLSEKTNGFFNVFNEALDFSTKDLLSFMMQSPDSNIRVRVELRNSQGGVEPVSKDVIINRANEWVRVSVNFGDLIEDQNNYDTLVIIPDYEPAQNREPLGDGYYFDNFQQYNSDLFFDVDLALEKKLLNEGIDTSGEDGLLLREDIRAITFLNLSGLPNDQFDEIDPPGIGILSARGLENFESLEDLRIEGNAIRTLDLSKNTNLKALRAWQCRLNEVNLSNLDQLVFIGLNYNELRQLDLVSNTSVEVLGLANNNLVDINLPKTEALRLLFLQNNRLDALDLTTIEENLIQLNLVDNSELSCIQVSDENTALSNQGWQKDNTANYSTFCDQLIDVNSNIPRLRVTLNTAGSPYSSNPVFDPGPFAAPEPSLFILEFELIYPEEAVERSPVDISFSAFGEDAEYALDRSDESKDFFLDLSNSVFNGGLLESLQESAFGCSSTFSIASNEDPDIPDAQLAFKIIDDTSFETVMPGEEIIFTIFDSADNDFNIEFLDGNRNLDFSLIIEQNTVDAGQIFNYALGIENSGSTEGSQDTITAILYEKEESRDGVPPKEFKVSEDLVLSIDLSPRETGILEDETPAEASDYDLPANQTTVTIPAGESAASFTINLPDDLPPDMDKDVYNLNLSGIDGPSGVLFNLLTPDPVPITIIDKDGSFDIVVTSPAEFQISNNLYEMEEGEVLTVELQAERGTPPNKKYTVNVAPLAAGNNTAEESNDYEIVDLNQSGTLEFTSGSTNSNAIEIRAIADANFTEETELLELEITTDRIADGNLPFQFQDPVTNEKSGSLVLPIRIKNVLASGIRAVENRISTFEQSGEYAEFEVFLSSPNTTGKPIKVPFRISSNSQAQFGQDKDFQLQIDNRFLERTSEFFVSIEPDHTSGYIRLFPEADMIDDEEDEKVFIEILDSSGFSVPNSDEFPNSAFVTISAEDPNADDDEDGVRNSDDLCPDTPAGSVVDATGCAVFSLPTNNFRIQSNGESCRESDDGLISIEVEDTSFTYTATLTGGNAPSSGQQFSESTSFTNLQADDDYKLCITVEGQADYEQCFDIVLTQPQALSVFSKVNQDDSKVTLDLEGGQVYYIELNDVFYQTTESQITLELEKTENKLRITTDKFCQGSFEKTIILTDQILVYPNPVGAEDLSVYVGQVSTEEVRINLYNSVGTLVSTQTYVPEAGLIRMNLSDYSAGLYLLNISTNQTLKTFKLIKR